MKRSTFTTLLLVSLSLLVADTAFAQEAAAGDGRGSIGIGAAIAISVAALGGGIGQGLAAKAALEGIARNPNASGKIQTPFILGLAFIESLVIYGLLIAYLLQSKI